MHPTPYLFFNGNCAEAMDTYADILDGEIVARMPASEMPPEYAVADDRKGWVMHSELRIGDGRIYASDSLMGDPEAMSGCSIMMDFPTKDRAQAVYDKLADGGEVQMPFASTFWSAGFGTLTDRFGIKWMIGTDEAP